MASSVVGRHNKLIMSCLVVVCMVVVSAQAKAKAKDLTILCGDVWNVLRPCYTYIDVGGSAPADCCNAVKWLYNLPTTWGRQSVCTCMNQFILWWPQIDNNIRQLPTKCGFSLPYNISPSMDCNTVQ